MNRFVLNSSLPAPVPTPDGLDAPFWLGTRAHELRVQRCASCATFRWTPEWICYLCHSFETDWPAVEPQGVLHSFQRVWHPVTPALAGVVPYVNVLVELPHADGVRLVGNYAGDPLDELVIGMAVSAVFEDHDDAAVPYTLVQWRRA